MTDNITLPRAVVEQVREAFKELDYASEPEVNEIARTALAAPCPEPRPSFADPEPSGYAYRYNDGVLRFNGGSTINGAPPIEVLPYWFAPPTAAPSEDIDALRQELAAVLSDWNSLVRASGSRTNGGAVGHVAALRRDAERYRWMTEDHQENETRRRVYSVTLLFNAHRKEHIDAAIDAAMEPATEPAIGATGES